MPARPLTRAAALLAILSCSLTVQSETKTPAQVDAERPELAARVQASLPASPLPQAAEVLAVSAAGDTVFVDLGLPAAFVAEELDAYRSDAIVAHLVGLLHPHGFRHFRVRVRTESGALVPLSALLAPVPRPVPEVPENSDPAPAILGGPGAKGIAPPVPAPARPQGALTGKTVWLSPGHGWLWSGSSWLTQRPNTFGIVEDFSNAEAVLAYLARYLWNMGAEVWTVRERSLNSNEVIVDNDDGAPAYRESGTWTTSATPGWQGSTYRYAYAQAGTTATATWSPTVPEAGWYPVYAWFLHGANRADDVRFLIRHAGGETTVRVSQEVHGQTWRFLGEFYFEAGDGGSVTLLNQSSDTGQVVIADAIRLGGGVGESGEPRFEEAALHYVGFQGYTGAPNDVVARPLYAEWELAKGYAGEDAVYVSWHSNCCGASGTSSYIHSYDPTPGSADLQQWVHDELIADLRTDWRSGWTDRGTLSADFGEVRELDSMPGVLLEVAFHDTESPGDADDLKEPRFRQILARAVAQGLVRYFADRDGTGVVLAPEPPTHLSVRTTGSGQVTLDWQPAAVGGAGGDAATAYMVYRSTNGRGFDNGTRVATNRLRLDGLTPGETLYFRVTALNAGGESFPTPVLAVRPSSGGTQPSFLLIDGFDRLDKWAMISQYDGPTLGTTKRMFLERMNRFDYAVEHGTALDACAIAFDGATDEAVTAGRVDVLAYSALDWLVGEDSSADQAISAAERALLADYLDGGGRLLISGAEIGYYLARPGAGVDPAFYNGYLKSQYVGDDAATYSFAGLPGGPFSGISGDFGDGTDGYYDVDYPDRLAATGGAYVALDYQGGSGDGGAVVYEGGDFRVVNFGFPLEAITDQGVRDALICAAARTLVEGQEQVLTVEVVGSGQVTSAPAGIACPGDCDAPFAAGALVDLIATPAPGWCLEAWSGDADCTDGRVSMDGARRCVATFTDCPTTCILGDQTARLRLDELRAVRARLLEGHPHGRWLVDAYDAHAAEVTGRLLTDAHLRRRALELIGRLAPALAGRVELRLDDAERQAVRRFARALRQGASEALAADLDAFLKLTR